ncbi:YihY family inner membrane protein [Rhodospirillaceae bacterium KN72]|uniref:UPF0761 membrane protein HH303_07855 n=1 Tax=Pacificispira spongiicola TaxID=2729598 RepID=A0A7Y0DZC7_9PROT|nr:YihY family inner membrane protein [Pacificispira spongiicola]NMM44389.1 YihY family inner membrane protein [Pacificispira spongiicola]
MNDTTATPVTRMRPPPRPVANLFGFCGYAINRFLHDDGQQRAAALTFTSLLAMVPLLAVSFAIFAAFPAYESLKGRVQSFLFEQFVPSVGAEVQGYLEQFTAQTGQLTAVGIVFLAVSAVMLLMTISSTFNRIWKVKQTRGVISRLLVFWAVLTLTPMLFGASISLSSYLFAAARASGVESVTGNLTRFAFVIPFLLQTAGLMVLYLVMPNFPVRRRDAMIGGLVAGIMLDLLKRGFGLYVTNFPTYETIYGAMATVPIFLMWVYFSWMVVIFGAEVTAALPEWRHGSRNPRQEGMTPLRKLSAALAVLNALHRASLQGETLSERRLTQTTRVGPQEQGWAAERLRKKQYITRTDKNGWVLSRDLSQVDLATLYTDLGLDLGGRLPERLRDAAWLRRFAELKTGLSASQQEIFATDLKSLLAPADPSSEPLPDEDHEEDEDGKPGFKLYARVLGLVGLGTLAQGS